MLLGEWVTPQSGDDYDGRIAEDIVGPFKGGPGTYGVLVAGS